MHRIIILYLLFTSLTGAQSITWVFSGTGMAGDVAELASSSTGELYAVTYSEGFCKSLNNGINWTSSNSGLSDLSCRSIAVAPNGYLYIGTLSGILFKSSDGGDNWNELDNLNFLEIRSVRVAPNGFIYYGTFGGRFVRSTDNATNWSVLYTFPSGILCMEINSYGHILIGTESNGYFYSYDNGNTWADGFNWNTRVTAVGFDNDYALISLRESPNSFSRCYYTATLSGELQILDGPDEYTNVFAFNSLNHIFIGTDNGVYRVKELQGTLENVSSGITSSPETYAMLKLSGDYLLAGGTSVWRTENSTITNVNIGESIIESFDIFQNYPNPFNPSTTIKYQIPELSFVTIKVYDVLGNEISTIVNEEKPAGEYEVEFDGNGLTSGIYFYQLRAGDYTDTKKMILLK